MENICRYRSLEAFCRHRARLVGEDFDAWRERAETFSRLAAAESRSAPRTIDIENTAATDD